MALNLTIIDNFLPKKEFNEIYHNISLLEWRHDDNYFSNFKEDFPDYGDSSHVWYANGPLSPKDFSIFKTALRKKLRKKVVHCETNSWTFVNSKKPIPHIDYMKGKCEHQLIFFVRSDEIINGGTGFYRRNKKRADLDVHIGFKENRAILFESKDCLHSPLLWNADSKTTGRYSAIFQLVIKDI